MDDAQLLQEYIRQKSPAALDSLVRRHIPMVYGAAMRQLHDTHLAEDVTQAVFVVLMRRAHSLSPQVLLPGWLFKVTGYAVADARKRQMRRERHEQEAAAMYPTATEDDPQAAWDQMMPLLDDAVASLPAADRDVVVLKYLQGKSHAEVAQALKTTENATRQRVFRAVQKLRSFFSAHGVALTEATLGLALVNASADAAPPALADQVLTVLSGPPAGTVVNIAEGVIQMMRWTTVKMAAAVCLSMMLLAGLAVALLRAVPAAPANKAAAARPATQPATQPAVDLSPKGVIVAAYRAGLSGNEQGMLDAFDQPTPHQQATLKMVVHAMAAAQELSAAITGKFGAEAGKQVMLIIGMGVLPTDVQDAKETIAGQTAIVDMGTAGPGKIPMVEIAGKWKVAPMVLDSLNVNSVSEIDKLTPVLHQLAADVTGGKFKTLAEMQQAIEKMK